MSGLNKQVKRLKLSAESLFTISFLSKMKGLVILIMFCHATSAVKHVLKIYLTGSTGLTSIPAFETVAEVDDIQIAYCSKKIIEVKQDWLHKKLNNDPQLFEFVKWGCFVSNPAFFKRTIDALLKKLKQRKGIHTFQGIGGCELNMETREVTGFLKYGYDGEDFIELDLTGLKWIPLRQKAVFLQQSWDYFIEYIHYHIYLLTSKCHEILSDTLDAGHGTLLRTDYPSVSLLQKTPSSPVRCHATGFYPKRFLMFWRKDGEEIHEGVDPGDILNNEDNTFQYRVDLDISSIPPEDWARYDCVFQFTGAEDKILIKLDKEVIKTNRSEDESSQRKIIIIAVISAMISIIITALAFTAFKKRNDRPVTPESETIPLRN